MTARARLALLALLVAVAAVATPRATAVDITGTWKASFDTQIGQQNYVYTFKVSGTALTGTAKSDMGGEVELKDGKVDGDTVTFVENFSFQGMDIRIDYKGQIASDDEIKFTRQVGDFATEQLVATRVKP
jgi:hypothetical protein